MFLKFRADAALHQSNANAQAVIAIKKHGNTSMRIMASYALGKSVANSSIGGTLTFIQIK